MKKKLFVLIVLFLSVLPLNVKAGESDSYVSWTLDMGVVAHQMRNGSEHMTNLAMMKVNEKIAYCIEPGVVGDNNAWYSSTTNINDTPLAGIDTKKLSLIGYYGYGYGNHNTKEYYMATQELIWRLMGVENVWWTDKKYGGNILNVEKEKEEIMNLVNNYEVLPKFDFKKKYIVGDEITLSDKNNVLEGYEVKNNENVKINGNNITVKITENTKFTLARKNNGKSPIYYYKKGFQTIGTFEYAYDYENDYTLISEYGKFIVDKYDNETQSKTSIVNDASLEGALYGLYDAKGNLLDSKKTNSNGMIVFDKLPKGTYEVREITPSTGYMLSSTWYQTYLASNRLEVTFKDYEKIIQNEITITKFFKSDNDELLPEENIEFEIYDNNDILYGKYKTNKEGIIKLTLPYGTYTLKQVTTKDGYDFAEDTNIIVKTKKEKQELTLINEKLPEDDFVEEPKKEEKQEEIKELPNTGKKMIFIPFSILQILVLLILKYEKQNN